MFPMTCRWFSFEIPFFFLLEFLIEDLWYFFRKRKGLMEKYVGVWSQRQNFQIISCYIFIKSSLLKNFITQLSVICDCGGCERIHNVPTVSQMLHSTILNHSDGLSLLWLTKWKGASFKIYWGVFHIRWRKGWSFAHFPRHRQHNSAF